MSNASTFDLVVGGDDLEELRVAYQLLQAASGEWEMLPIEHNLIPEGGFRFRARVWTDEEAGGPIVSGEGGVLADLIGAFPELDIVGRFRDEIGSGVLVGQNKEYERRLDEEEEGEPMEDPRAPLIVWSDTTLSPQAEPFSTQLEAIGMLLYRALEAQEIGCTLVEESTSTWSVSGLVASLELEQVQQLCRDLRRLRVPLDTRLERGSRILSVWPISHRPWRRLF
jgi:hypothetical protein